MNLLAVLYFFVTIWGLGYTATRWVKDAEEPIERNIMRLGLGLAGFVVLGLICNVLHIPLHWWLFFIVAAIMPVYDLVINLQKKSAHKISMPKLTVGMLILVAVFSVSFFMYYKGATAYPWLEDSDPWAHARVSSYIADQGTAYEPEAIPHDFFQYTDAYPPGYPILNAMIFQITKDPFWSLKFFNALLLSLGLLFFHYFVYRFTKSKKKALIATVLLAALPGYMSHFIWALTLSVLLYYVAFYALEMIANDKRWWYVAGGAIAAILLTQPTTAFKFGIFLGVYWGVKALIGKELHWNIIFAGILGLVLAVALWWGPMFLQWGYPEIVTVGLYQGTTSNVLNPTANLVWGWSDFFHARSAAEGNRINNPIGYGPVAFSLFLLSAALIFINLKTYLKKPWVIISLIWSILAFLMIQGGRLPVRMDPHRSWLLMAIFIAIIVAEGISQAGALLKAFKIPGIVITVVLVSLILVTSFPAKYAVNTAIWGNDGAVTEGEIQGYMWMRDNLPLQTEVFGYGNWEKIITYGMYSCEWCEDTYTFRQGLLNASTDELYIFLKPRYEYIAMDAASILVYRNQLGNQTEAHVTGRIQELVDSPKFQPVHQTASMIIFKIL